MQIDKLLHVLAGLVIAAVSLALMPKEPIAAFCAAMVAGWVKEWVWDAWLGKGTFDKWDAVATTAGGGGMVVIYLVVEKLLHLA